MPPFQATSMDGKLCVEVQHAQDLHGSEYRLFDHTSAVLGMRRIRPYVTCKVCWAAQETPPQSSNFIEAGNGDYAYWGQKLMFSLSNDFWNASVFKVILEVFDKRELQGVLRGDSLIGRAEFNVDPAVLDVTPQQEVALQTSRGAPAGKLHLGFQIQAPQEAFNVMAHSSQGSLAAAAKAFAQTLRQQGALEELMNARPTAMREMPAERVDAVRNLLRPWLSKFCLQSLCLSGNEADESAIRSLWKLARSAQEIIACCAQLGEDDDVPGIVVQWLKNYFSNSAKVEADLNETRLRELLAMYQPGGNQSDPWARLQDFGARLPSGSPLELAFSLATRLEEAQRGNEMEIFTCEEIIQNGRVAPGMAAVVRSSSGGIGGHVFIYEHRSIKDWQAQCSSDPCTRDPLSAHEIIPIS